jgi:hypothetical protein
MFKRQIPTINYNTLSHLSEEQEQEIRNIAMSKKISMLESAYLYFDNDKKGNSTLQKYTFDKHSWRI